MIYILSAATMQLVHRNAGITVGMLQLNSAKCLYHHRCSVTVGWLVVGHTSELWPKDQDVTWHRDLVVAKVTLW